LYWDGIMRRAVVSCSITLLMFVGICPQAGAADQKFNVLFIISDDLRTELGCYGGLAKTPNLDALADTGVKFDRAYCQFPLCCPSRTSMLTGRYPQTTGVLGNRTWFGHEHPEFVSLPKYFQQNGYVTLRAGKIFHGGLDDDAAWTVGGESRTFDLRQPASQVETQAERTAVAKREHSDRWVVLRGEGERHGDYRASDRAIKLLDEYQQQPFFLAVGFANPHSPLQAPQRFYDLYNETVTRHTATTAPKVFTPAEAGWAAVCYGLVRHPEFHTY